jgi:hypothetical protein
MKTGKRMECLGASIEIEDIIVKIIEDKFKESRIRDKIAILNFGDIVTSSLESLFVFYKSELRAIGCDDAEIEFKIPIARKKIGGIDINQNLILELIIKAIRDYYLIGVNNIGGKISYSATSPRLYVANDSAKYPSWQDYENKFVFNDKYLTFKITGKQILFNDGVIFTTDATEVDKCQKSELVNNITKKKNK